MKKPEEYKCHELLKNWTDWAAFRRFYSARNYVIFTQEELEKVFVEAGFSAKQDCGYSYIYYANGDVETEHRHGISYAKSIGLNTVADIVLVNTVVTDPSRRNFLNDFRRINVSMSRAKDKLFIFGNPFTLQQINMSNNAGISRRFFDDIIKEIRRTGQMMIFEQGELHNDQSRFGFKIK